jgi:hypothetical protein
MIYSNLKTSNTKASNSNNLNKYILNKTVDHYVNLDVVIMLKTILKNFNKNYNYFYLDIGSAHPLIINITKYFYNDKKNLSYGYKGKGICIDPRNFSKSYKMYRSKDIFINRAFSKKKFEYLYMLKNEKNIFQANSATIKKKYYYKLKNEKKFLLKKLKVNTCDAKFIYDQIKKRNNQENVIFPLVKIDAEGSDLMIIKNLINFGFRIGCIVIEDKNINLSNIRTSKIFKFLKKKNFLPLLKTLENTIYINLAFKEFNFLPKKMLKF